MRCGWRDRWYLRGDARPTERGSISSPGTRLRCLGSLSVARRRRESSKQARSQRKKGIRKRISNAILDFQDLWNLNEEERRKITDELYAEGELFKSLVYMIAFLRYCSKDVDHDLEWIIRGSVITSMRHEGSTTIEENGREDTIDVLDDVVVEIAPGYKRVPTSDSLLEKYRSGEALNGEQLGQLIGSGLMTEEDWDRLQGMYGPGR